MSIGSANQLTLDNLTRDSYSTSQKEVSRLPVLSEQRDPWDRPATGRKEEPVSRQTSGYGSGYSSSYSSQAPASSYRSTYDTGYRGENIPTKVDRTCKGLLSAARALPSSQRSQEDLLREKEEAKKVKGFWGGVKGFLSSETTKEVALVMSIIALKTALVFVYVKADQKKVRAAEFI